MVLAILPLTEKSTNDRPRVGFALGDEGIIIYSGKRRERHTYSIDVTNLTMVRHIDTDKVLMGRDILTLSYLAYLYSLKLTNTRTIRRLTSVDRDVVTTMKENIFKDFDLVRYKIATLRCVRLGLTPNDTNAISKQFKICGLREVDSFMYHLLYFNNDLEDFYSAIADIQDKSFILSVQTIPNEITPEVVKEFEKAANYHANSIRFVAHANRFEVLDLKNDLTQRAIQAYYWVRPFVSKEHGVNYGKRSCFGYAQTLREFYQSPDRARAINTGEGFDNANHMLDDNLSSYDSIYDEEDKVIDMIDEKAVYR